MSEAVTSTGNVSPPEAKILYGQKVGMTQIYDKHGVITPVTVVAAGPCHVVQILQRDKNGYDALQVGFGEVKESSVNKPQKGQTAKAGISPVRWVREIRTPLAAQFKVGQTLKVNVFAEGDYVDVIGTSKGKGFAGTVKRHNFGGGPSTHGQSDRQRAPGASGSNTYPGRVLRGKKMPGHLGHERVTVQHLEVVEVDASRDLLMLRGSVPGPNQGVVMIQQTVKRVKVRQDHAPVASKRDKGAKKDAGKAAAPAAKAKGGK